MRTILNFLKLLPVMDVFKRLFGIVVFVLMTLAYAVIGVSALDVGNLILGFGALVVAPIGLLGVVFAARGDI
jgi:hypothetical protein